jgi:DNA-binding response OmpR family regulator
METRIINVLIIEDDENDFFIIKDIFSNINYNRYNLYWSNRYEDAIEKIKNNNYDLLLIDYRLGSYNGLDLIKECKQNNIKSSLILITGYDQYSLDIEAMETGADNYINKEDIDKEVFERTIRYTLNNNKNNSIKIDDLKYFDSNKKILLESALNFHFASIL